MKTSSIFWGTLLILLGIFFLLNNIGIVNYDISFVFDLWPIFLVIWGVSLLKVKPVVKKVLAGISAATVTLFIIALVNKDWRIDIGDFDFDDGREANYYDSTDSLESEFTFPLDTNYKSARLDFSTGAREISFASVEDKLISADSKGYFVPPSIDMTDSGKTVVLSFNPDGSKSSKKWKNDRDLYVNLGKNIAWELDFNIGAVEFTADFRENNIRIFELNTGAADIELEFGDKADTLNIDIQAGASSVSIRIPDNLACEISTDLGFSGKDFDDFRKIGSGLYRTENFGKAKKLVFINLQGGVSSFEVARVKPDKI